ncbi:hypothetical protein, partial [Mycobacterium avium]|uniref:hypothetical protein n=1 Tax=Mycobacterium avium TaxID=1764 RepID=UPI001F409F67
VFGKRTHLQRLLAWVPPIYPAKNNPSRFPRHRHPVPLRAAVRTLPRTSAKSADNAPVSASNRATATWLR